MNWLVSALLNHLWQSTVCAGAVAVLAVVLRKNSAHVRYRLWFAASVKFLIPFSLLVHVGMNVGWITSPPARPAVIPMPPIQSVASPPPVAASAVTSPPVSVVDAFAEPLARVDETALAEARASLHSEITYRMRRYKRCKQEEHAEHER